MSSSNFTTDVVVASSDDATKFPLNQPSKFTVDITPNINYQRDLHCRLKAITFPKQWVRFASAIIRWRRLTDTQWISTVAPLRTQNLYSLLEAQTQVRTALFAANAPISFVSEVMPQEYLTIRVAAGYAVEISSMLAPVLGYVGRTLLQSLQLQPKDFTCPYKSFINTIEIVYLLCDAVAPKCIGREIKPVLTYCFCSDFDKAGQPVLQYQSSFDSVLFQDSSISLLSFQLVDVEFRQLEFTAASQVFVHLQVFTI